MNPSRDLVPFGRHVVPRTRSAPVRPTGPRPVAPRPGPRPPAPVGRTGPSFSTSTGSTSSAQLPGGVEGVPASTSMTLGPDWATLGRFGFVAALLLIAGPGIGRTIAGPAGIIIGSGAAAALLLVAPHLTGVLTRLDALARWLRRPRTGRVIDAYEVVAEAPLEGSLEARGACVRACVMDVSGVGAIAGRAVCELVKGAGERAIRSSAAGVRPVSPTTRERGELGAV